MSQKVLSTDMASLISSMKLAQQYASTAVDGDYKKGMLKAAHVLAMDSKNLFDVIDKKEFYKGYTSKINLNKNHNSYEALYSLIYSMRVLCWILNNDIKLPKGKYYEKIASVIN